MWTHFLHPGLRKNRLWWSRFSDVLGKLLELRTHNLPSGRLQKRLWWSRWGDVQGVERPYELIFCILIVE
jgi:hypothetical protein